MNSHSLGYLADTTPGRPLADRSQPPLNNARTDREIAEALEDVQVVLGVLIDQLGLRDRVLTAVAEKRADADRSRVEIERSLGYGTDPEGQSRR